MPPVFVAPAPSWDRGTPDAVMAVGSGQPIAASAPFEVKRFVVPTGFTTPKRVRAIALKQGDRRVVRHAAFYEESSGRWLGAWTPWQTAAELPKGVAHHLPANARVSRRDRLQRNRRSRDRQERAGFLFRSGRP